MFHRRIQYFLSSFQLQGGLPFFEAVLKSVSIAGIRENGILMSSVVHCISSEDINVFPLNNFSNVMILACS